jgi:hypothetical protein
MFVRLLCGVALCFGSLLILAPPAAADVDIGYFGTNILVFAPVGGVVEADASGRGIIDYQGGDEPKSRWQATFRFSGLDPDTDYAVVVKGRSGDPGTDEARALSPLCSFTTDENGRGTCFWFFRGLARLNVVQVRQQADGSGRRMLQASRDGDPGSIATTPNQFSPGGQLPARRNANVTHVPRGKSPNKAAPAPRAAETPTPTP